MQFSEKKKTIHRIVGLRGKHLVPMGLFENRKVDLPVSVFSTNPFEKRLLNPLSCSKIAVDGTTVDSVEQLFPPCEKQSEKVDGSVNKHGVFHARLFFNSLA